MYTLGIGGSPNLLHELRFRIGPESLHDAGAALIHNGEIVAAFEEERLNRIKHTNKMPLMAIKACLKSGSIRASDVDCFSFSISTDMLKRFLTGYCLKEGITLPDPRQFILNLFEEHLKTEIALDKIEFFEHHYCHAVTAFYPSGFEAALVLTMDGSGGEYSGSVYEGCGDKLLQVQTFSNDQSLGLLYTSVTRLLGFDYFDEYKVMGLAPYGNPETYRKVFEGFYELLPDGNYKLMFGGLETGILDICPRISQAGSFQKVHADIAASLQETLERIAFHVVRHFQSVTRQSKLCLAGGVALNCTMNGKLISSGLFDDVFVFPGASDSGLPVGSAMAAYFKRCPKPKRFPLKTLHLGSDIDATDDVIKSLDRWSAFISYSQMENIFLSASELLADDKVIGWVQGRSEFAPRALGNRSILADPRPARNKERINYIVKKREGFRPFGPSVMEEYVDEYFELPSARRDYSHMTFAFKTRMRYRRILEAVTHVDGSARIQTVSRRDNPPYWTLINSFREITGVPVLLNTSFNNNAEPIVDSVEDAVVSFLTTDLDYLVINDLIVSKNAAPGDLALLYLSLGPQMILRRVETRRWLHDSNLEERFEVINTFNERSLEVPAKVFQVLAKANGSISLDCVYAGLNIWQPLEKEMLTKTIFDLWQKRMVLLSPQQVRC